MHVPDLVTGPRPAAATRADGDNDRHPRRGDGEAEDFGSVVEKAGRKPARDARAAEPEPAAQVAGATLQQPAATPETPTLGLPPAPAAAPSVEAEATSPISAAPKADAPASAPDPASPVAAASITVPPTATPPEAPEPADARQAPAPAVEATPHPLRLAAAGPSREQGADQSADANVTPLPSTGGPETARGPVAPTVKVETQAASTQAASTQAASTEAASGQPAISAVPPAPPDEAGDAEPLGRAGRAPGAEPPAARPAAQAAMHGAVGDPPAPSAAPGPEFTIREASGGGWRLAPAASAHAPADQAVPATTGQALAAQITLAIGGAEDRRVEIRLDPPELGRVQIHLTPRDGGLQAVVIAERPETHDLLRRHAETLTRDLNAAGYDSVSLDFTAGGQPTPGRDEAPVPERSYLATPAPMGPEPAATAPARRAGASGLDVRL